MSWGSGQGWRMEDLLDEPGLGAGLEESIIPGVTGRSGVWSQRSSSDTTREELSFRADSVKAAEPRPRSAAATERPRSAATTERSGHGATTERRLTIGSGLLQFH